MLSSGKKPNQGHQLSSGDGACIDGGWESEDVWAAPHSAGAHWKRRSTIKVSVVTFGGLKINADLMFWAMSIFECSQLMMLT